MALHLTRKAGEAIILQTPSGDAIVTVVAIGGRRVRLAVDAPDAITIWRREFVHGGRGASAPPTARKTKQRRVLTLAGLLLMLHALFAAFVPQASAMVACNDSGLLTRGGIVTQVCWRCIFPIRIGGAPIGGLPTQVPDSLAPPVCICPGRLLGLPTPGLTMGLWYPARLIEVVRTPGCSPVLGGPLSTVLSGVVGNLAGAGPGDEEAHGTSYDFNWWYFPVAAVFDLLVDGLCSQIFAIDLDLVYLSFLDPTWRNDQLAAFTHPEGILFASAPAQAACIADAVATTAWKPIPGMYWCHGAWGSGYPMTGNAGYVGSEPREASLAGSRAIAAMHRRLLAHLSYGPAGLCFNPPWPMLPKQQYRLQTFHPIPELLNNHWIGTPTLLWGEWRGLPVVGEDWVWLLWEYEECCANL